MRVLTVVSVFHDHLWIHTLWFLLAASTKQLYDITTHSVKTIMKTTYNLWRVKLWSFCFGFNFPSTSFKIEASQTTPQLGFWVDQTAQLFVLLFLVSPSRFVVVPLVNRCFLLYFLKKTGSDFLFLHYHRILGGFEWVMQMTQYPWDVPNKNPCLLIAHLYMHAI